MERIAHVLVEHWVFLVLGIVLCVLGGCLMGIVKFIIASPYVTVRHAALRATAGGLLVGIAINVIVLLIERAHGMTPLPIQEFAAFAAAGGIVSGLSAVLTLTLGLPGLRSAAGIKDEMCTYNVRGEERLKI